MTYRNTRDLFAFSVTFVLGKVLRAGQCSLDLFLSVHFSFFMSAFRSSPVCVNVFGNRHKSSFMSATCILPKSSTEKEVGEIYFQSGNTDILHSVSVTWENYCFIFCISINDSWILFWFNDTHKKCIGTSYVYVLLLMLCCWYFKNA